MSALTHARARIWLLLSALALLAVGCSNGTKKGVGEPGATIDAAPSAAARCDKQRPHVAELYKKAEPADVDAKKQKRRDMERADNVNMMLTECKKNPDRFAPCIEKATSVKQLESQCVIRLDDEGRVEGTYFKNNP